MTPKKTAIQKVEHSRFVTYWKKAQDFYRTMLSAYSESNWHSVGLEAVHCAISSTDALLVHHSGMRSTGLDHRDTVHLLVGQIKAEGIKKNADTLLRILGMKNLVEYEDRLFTQREASEILKRTERYFNWIKNQLPRGA